MVFICGASCNKVTPTDEVAATDLLNNRQEFGYIDHLPNVHHVITTDGVAWKYSFVPVYLEVKNAVKF